MAGEVEGFEAADYLRPHLAHRFNKASAPSNTSSVLHLFNSLSKSVVAAFMMPQTSRLPPTAACIAMLVLSEQEPYSVTDNPGRICHRRAICRVSAGRRTIRGA